MDATIEVEVFLIAPFVFEKHSSGTMVKGRDDTIYLGPYDGGVQYEQGIEWLLLVFIGTSYSINICILVYHSWIFVFC